MGCRTCERMIAWLVTCLAAFFFVVAVTGCALFGPGQGHSSSTALLALLTTAGLAALTLGLGVSLLAAVGISFGGGSVMLNLLPKYPLAKAASDAGGSSGGWDWKTWVILGFLGWWAIKFLAPRYRELALTVLGKLLTLRLPSAAKAVAKASGMAHTRPTPAQPTS